MFFPCLVKRIPKASTGFSAVVTVILTIGDADGSLLLLVTEIDKFIDCV